MRYFGRQEDLEHLQAEADEITMTLLAEEAQLSGEEPPQWWLDAQEESHKLEEES